MPIFIFFITLLVASTSSATLSSDVKGVWLTEGGDSKVELFRCQDRICGRIVWLKDPTYRDSHNGPVGTEKTDRKNPDPALRTRPIVGLQVMEGLSATGENQWEGGSCYDPHGGKFYQCRMKLVAPDQLELRGYVGFSLFGRTFVLTR